MLNGVIAKKLKVLLSYLPVDVGGHSTSFLKLGQYHTRTI